jgi:hypothetical protein
VNERLIYEWLKPELVGDDWKLYGDLDDCGVYQMDAFRDGKPSMALPPLDMNTWHGEVLPKLSKEADVTFRHGHWDIQPWKRAWHGPHWAREDPWQALTDYLEAK